MQATLMAGPFLWRPYREAEDAMIVHVDLALDASRETPSLRRRPENIGDFCVAPAIACQPVEQ